MLLRGWEMRLNARYAVVLLSRRCECFHEIDFSNPAGRFVEDALHCARISSFYVLRSNDSLAAARASLARTQLKVDQSEALIAAADKLIIALDREIISRPNSA
jgi:hypothetical protein